MIVYVESNFVLEIALGQEQALSAEAILSMAEDDSIDLAFPAFALSEPFSTITYHGAERQKLLSSLSQELGQLERSRAHQEVVSLLRPLPIILTEIQKMETDRLESTVGQMLKVGRAINLSEMSFQQALLYGEDYSLSPQDAIIYSVILADIKEHPTQELKCFISRDKKGFTLPAI
ncbi:MAG: hypothetical protein EXR50_00490 [Dehalococcoidia bacterium]|nr:hypothetical protein [Dehalococcoidia bacterium]